MQYYILMFVCQEFIVLHTMYYNAHIIAYYSVGLILTLEATGFNPCIIIRFQPCFITIELTGIHVKLYSVCFLRLLDSGVVYKKMWNLVYVLGFLEAMVNRDSIDVTWFLRLTFRALDCYVIMTMGSESPPFTSMTSQLLFFKVTELLSIHGYKKMFK